MRVSVKEKQAKAFLTRRGYVVVMPRVIPIKPGVNEVDQVADLIGSKADLALILGISRAAVHKWGRTGLIPWDKARKIREWVQENAPDKYEDLDTMLRPER